MLVVEGVRITGLATGVAVGLLQWGLFLRERVLAGPVAAGCRDRLAAGLDGDVGVWH